MSKRITISQAEHFAHIEAEFGEPAMDVIREMYDDGIALRIIAGALDVPGDTLMGWVRRWGWSRPDIGRNRAHPVYERITQEFGHNAIALVCSDRKMGMKYHEIAKKYGISNPTIIRWLRIGLPSFVGDKYEPVQVAPPVISDEERRRRRLACIAHNQEMREGKAGWSADNFGIFKRRQANNNSLELQRVE
jgi:hypothetical protein